MATGIPLRRSEQEQFYTQPMGVPYVPPMRTEASEREAIAVSEEYKNIFIQIAAIAAVGAIVLGLALYATKPDFLLRVKGDKNGGMKTANLIAICTIAFILIATALYFMRQSIW